MLFRSRWAEAAIFLRETEHIEPGRALNPPVFSDVPGVVAYYLGADPRRPGEYAVVSSLPEEPIDVRGRAWYVVEAKTISPEYRRWFDENCTLEARFEAKTGPINRSVYVYQHTGRATSEAKVEASQGSRIP